MEMYSNESYLVKMLSCKKMPYLEAKSAIFLGKFLYFKLFAGVKCLANIMSVEVLYPYSTKTREVPSYWQIHE